MNQLFKRLRLNIKDTIIVVIGKTDFFKNNHNFWHIQETHGAWV